MKPYLILFYFILGAVTLQAQCPTSISFHNQQEIDQFSNTYPTCHHFKSVSIKGSSINNLSGLGTITSIEKTLSIDSTQLISLEGLGIVLDTTNNLNIFANNQLVSLNGLKIKNGLNYIRLFYNPHLNNLSAFDQISTIRDFLTITDAAIENLSGLKNLESLDGLSLYENDLLSDINTMPKLTKIRSLTLINNKLLSSALPCTHVTQIRWLYIIKNPKLQQLNGVQNIKRIDDLFIEDTPIQSLENFENLQEIDKYIKLENLAIKNLNGLDQIKEIDQLIISKNTLLTDVSLPNLERVKTKLIINNNESLALCNSLCPFINSPYLVSIHKNAIGCENIDAIPCFHQLHGSIFYDKNENKIKDADEVGIPNIFSFKNELGFWTLSDKHGDFTLRTKPNKSYTIEPNFNPDNWRLTTDSQSFTAIYDSTNLPVIQFGIVPQNEQHDVQVYILPYTNRHDQGAIKILLKNNGSYSESGKIVLTYQPELRYHEAFPTPNIIDSVSREITWNYEHLKPYSSITIDAYIPFKKRKYSWNIPSVQQLECTAYRLNQGQFKYTSNFIYKKYPFHDLCAHYVFPQGTKTDHLILKDTTLTYNINISESLRNDNYPLLIQTTFDSKLDLNTFELINADIGKLPEIKLDNGTLRAAYGYYSPDHSQLPSLTFQIQSNPNVEDGTIIETQTTIQQGSRCTSTLSNTLVSTPPKPLIQVDDERLILAPNPASDYFRVTARYPDWPYYSLGIYDLLGNQVKLSYGFDLYEQERIDISDLPAGSYIVIIRNSNSYNIDGYKRGKLMIIR